MDFQYKCGGEALIELQKIRLGDICKFQNGYAFKSKDFKRDGQYKVVKIKELKNGKVKFFEDTATIDLNIDEYDNYSINKGDVLFALTGDPVNKNNPLSWVGRVSIYQDNKVSLLNQRVCKIITDEKIIIKEYAYYYFRVFENFYTLAAKATGSASQANISTKTIADTEMMIPTVEIQRKIVKILSAIDYKIDNNNQINDNLLEQAVTLFNQLIRGQQKNGCIGDYCCVKSGFAFKSSWWQDSGIRVIKIGSINQDNLDINTCSFVSEDKISLASDFTVKGGDLLIAMTGATIGKFSLVPNTNDILLVNQRVGKFFLGENPIDKLPFIYCQLKQDEIYNEIINRGQGSAQPNISASDIISIACVIPESSIIDSFNTTTRPLFELIINNQLENRQLEVLRDNLLPKLMTGEFDISDIKF